MCSSCRSNKNPQDSEADIHIIGFRLVDRHANDRRRNDQTARISLHHPSMSKSATIQNNKQPNRPNSHRANSTVQSTLSTSTSHQAHTRRSVSATVRPGSFRPRRLGEAVSSQTRRRAQEEKTHPVIFLSPTHVSLEVSAPAHKPQPVDKPTKQGITPRSPPSAQDSGQLPHQNRQPTRCLHANPHLPDPAKAAPQQSCDTSKYR